MEQVVVHEMHDRGLATGREYVPFPWNQDRGDVQNAYAARHQFIPDLTWPEGVRIAVNFTCDFDTMLLRRLLNEPTNAAREGRIRRTGRYLAELFDAHGVKATIFTQASGLSDAV